MKPTFLLFLLLLFFLTRRIYTVFLKLLSFLIDFNRSIINFPFQTRFFCENSRHLGKCNHVNTSGRNKNVLRKLLRIPYRRLKAGFSVWWLGFCTLCFCFLTKMFHLNAPFFPLKCSVSPKKLLKCSDNAHYTNSFFN